MGAARFEYLGPFTWFGAVGVHIFFVISGFVIASSASGATAGEFLRGRFLRLYPAAWICATTTLVFSIALLGFTPASLFEPYLRSISLWLWGPWIDASYWTLPIEICFYTLIFGVLVFRRFDSIHWIALLLTTASGIFVTCTYLNIPLRSDVAIINFVLRNQHLFLLQYGCFFALGLWMWLSLQRNDPFIWIGFSLALATCFLEIIGNFSNTIAKTHAISSYFSGTPAVPLSVWGIAVGAMLVTTRYVAPLTPKSKGLLLVFRKVGLMTYPLYLLHEIIGVGLIRILVNLGLLPIVALILATSAMVAASFIVSSVLEPTVRNWVKYLWPTNSTPAAGLLSS
ncbi:Peptidoglycan/LPS O-acetylase OafA/YrhL, contains acyltransferase and SGNH-hydrolase domains [Bradyrhizobium lablabi]|uniref:Peptidoglycan/LPS O-acetylase OafA/YrhL, contains acyltransferase and SGNH-hydrolase domains n=2 Tax=Bradyrhizobium lablabi TaxID=722472 RepID=A0A1M6MPA8_9BRAD|nr:Peptidoglycan/LPS O-acetylase OafA/YrhL, contains acyltransferase and SGNH-hydrolase domains [Bradyrhizobium lablabi]